MRLQNPLLPRVARFQSARVFLAALLGWTLGGMCSCPVTTAGEPPSWIFRRSQYSHDPLTGARVAQYSRIPPVEPLPDPRLVTSGYRRTRTNLRDPAGSLDSFSNVSSYGNGRGGLDAEWERFHEAWLQSYTAGGYYYDQRVPVHPHRAYPHQGYPHQGYPHHGYPQPGFAPPPPAPYGSGP